MLINFNLHCHMYLLFSGNCQKDMQIERNTYEVLQRLSILLTDKTHLKDLFDKTKFRNDKRTF